MDHQRAIPEFCAEYTLACNSQNSCYQTKIGDRDIFQSNDAHPAPYVFWIMLIEAKCGMQGPINMPSSNSLLPQARRERVLYMPFESANA